MELQEKINQAIYDLTQQINIHDNMKYITDSDDVPAQLYIIECKLESIVKCIQKLEDYGN